MHKGNVRMTALVYFLLIIFFYISNSCAFGMTLEECVESALKNNRGLKSHEMSLLSAEEEVAISGTGFYPMFKMKGQYALIDKSDIFVVNRDTFSSGIPADDVELSSENRSTYGISLIMEQSIYTGGNLTNTLRKSKEMREEARHLIEKQKKSLIFEIRKTYYEALNEQLTRQALEKINLSQKERFRVLNELSIEGYAKKEDILQLETDIAFSELDLLKSRNRSVLAFRKLKKLMYYQDNSEFQLKGEPVNRTLMATAREIMESAHKVRDDLKISSSRIRTAEAEIEIAKSEWYPRATLQGRYSIQKETNITRPYAWMVITQMEWPIFEWGRTKAEVRKTEAASQRLRYEHDELERNISLELAEIINAIHEKEKEIKALEKLLKTIEYRLRLTVDNYEEGFSKLPDVIEAESELIRANNKYLAAMNELAIIIAQLEASSGLQESWFRNEDVYRPDLLSVSERITFLMHRKRMSNQPTVLNPEQEIEHIKPKQAISSAVVVQVGAFRSLQKAERLRQELQGRVGDKTILIQSIGELHYVWISGFDNKYDAKTHMSSNGLVDYIIREMP